MAIIIKGGLVASVGKPGESAYEIAKRNGYQGTEKEFADGLVDAFDAPTVEEMNAAIAAIPTPDVSGQINTHNNSLNAHADIREDINTLNEEINNKLSTLASISSVDSKISTHNTSTSAHNDIRILINALTERLNALANSDDTTLDQLSEIVAYIKNNKSLIDGVTTSKVNVNDIINNLTTNVANKPLSAAQGVAIKTSIDELDTAIGQKASVQIVTWGADD